MNNNDMLRSFIETLKSQFEDRLSVKTNWGRNEIQTQFNEAIVKALTTGFIYEEKK